LAILASGATDIGMKRKTNQDSIHLYPEKKLFIVADGMGGHNGGDIASQMSVKIFPEFVDDNFGKMEVSELLDKSISYVNRSIYDHGQKHSELKGMGTTICSMMFGEKEVYIGNVGDSRMYMLQNNKLFQMTRDHSLVQEKLNLGIYDRIGAFKDPQKNVLIRTVGFEPNVAVDVYKYKINKGDLFLVCSDGLHGKVSDEDIAFIVKEYIPNPKTATQEQLDGAISKLISQANANGGQDNISIILATDI
jgi:protein phosphatase